MDNKIYCNSLEELIEIVNSTLINEINLYKNISIDITKENTERLFHVIIKKETDNG